MPNLFTQFCKSNGKNPSEWQYVKKEEFKCNLAGISNKCYLATTFLHYGKQYRFFETEFSCYLTFMPDTISSRVISLHREIVESFGVVLSVYSHNSATCFENFEYIFNCSDDQETDSLLRKNHKLVHTASANSYCDYVKFFPVAYEANGNIVLYDDDGILYFYGNDFSRDDLVENADLNRLNFYRFKTMNSFQEYATLFFTQF